MCVPLLLFPQALLAALEGAVDEEEATTITTHLAFTRNAHADFIAQLEHSIDSRQDPSDPLLLAYGSLARRASRSAEQHVVSFLKRKIWNIEERKLNDTEALIHLLHSLGNAGSSMACACLMDYLRHWKEDVQLAAIDALRTHTADVAVQKALTATIQSSTSEELVEQVIQSLTEGLEHSDGVWPQRGLLLALVKKSLQSPERRLGELVLHYLEQLGPGHGHRLMRRLREALAAKEDSSSPRMKRTSTWDAINSVYELVAGYNQRLNDVHTYHRHRAYIWGRKLGVGRLYMQVAAGGFTGAKPDRSGYKVFTKGVVQGHVFGRTARAVHAEYLRRRSGTRVYEKRFARVVGLTLVNKAGYTDDDCSDTVRELTSGMLPLLYFQYSVFIFVGTLDFYVGLTVETKLRLKLSYCEENAKACVSLMPNVALRAEAGAGATFLVRAAAVVLQ